MFCFYHIKNMNIVTLIPARVGSTRFLGKPMAPIIGNPMIGHVLERVANHNNISLTAVTTCDIVIFDYVVSIGGTAVMKGDHHLLSNRTLKRIVAGWNWFRGEIQRVAIQIAHNFNAVTVFELFLAGNLTK